ncbi:DUF2207 domain-containing protein [Microbacterium hydrocarbonoxydans]|uniref:DUF2207 domain-containing protein n=1 Tax=Microbacterium hydrocarbonoxydans TaxID=273678 RepID=UPI0013DB6123|nr:DUF2207 domain-containing protein [Microbacterium hydrocarbonoxydans]
MAATRLLHAIAAVALAAVALLVPATAAAADPASAATTSVASNAKSAKDADAVAAASVRSDVNDFSYASWDARFEVGLDDEGRARMHVTETLAARFPDFDQNRGIVRGLPTTYENASLELEVTSVTDGNGAPVPYEIEEDDGILYVLTGDDDFVRGLTTYVIEYETRDVILSRDDGRADEFYWDLLPLDSTQAIEAFQAEILFDGKMSDRLSGSTSCYVGYYGVSTRCELTQRSEDGRSMFAVSAEGLDAGEGVTVAIGFEPGTVTQAPARQPNPVTDTVPALAAAGGVLLSLGSWVALLLFRRSRRRATGIIVAQYEVPDDMPPLLAAAIVPGAENVIPAEIVHLAVRGTLRIEEGSQPEQPRLRRLPGTPIPDQLDVEALDALFAGKKRKDVVTLPRASETFAGRMSALEKRGKDAATARGLTTTARSRAAVVVQWMAIAVVAVGFVLALWGVISGRVTAVPAMVAISVAVVLVLLSGLVTFIKHTVASAEGARAYEHLMGVHEFIRVAEADRLRMLQSYSGAERRKDGTADVIVLYERLLPYAMLFGMEKQWGKVLEAAYEQEQHGASWIGDPSAPFARSQLTAFAASTHAAATYSAPTTGSSSSSGGSFGGGFSGGGGGGGFSGGR